MMDTIYEMVTYVKYLAVIGDTIERYNTNSIGKKILLFPILLICAFLLIVITPFIMIGCLLRLVFLFIDWVIEALEDEAIWRYGLDCTAFLNFFIAIFALYGIMYVLYLFHRLLNFILGKTITEKYEGEAEMEYSSNFKRPDKDEVYIIEEDYK